MFKDWLLIQEHSNDTRSFGLRLLGDSDFEELDERQVASLGGTESFSRGDFYSESVLPTYENDGWVAFSFHKKRGVISRWKWGENFQGLSELKSYLTGYVSDKHTKNNEQYENYLFGYKGDDNTKFDEVRELRNQGLNKWKNDEQAVWKFVQDASNFLYKKFSQTRRPA